MSGVGEILDLAAMVPVIRRQQMADLRSVFLPPEMHPLCGWNGCHHRSARDHGEGSQPRYECEPHAIYGAFYERVRVPTGAAFGAMGTIAGLAGSLLSKDETVRDRARALLIEGVRSFVGNHKKKG